MVASIFFSIIIPTYKRLKQLSKCLEAISQVDYPIDKFEVIIVDDCGQVPLEPLVDSFKSKFQLRLLKQQVNKGPAMARNRGASEAKGSYLIFIDDDCSPATNWLKKIEIAVFNNPECLIGGKTINGLAENNYSAASQILIDYLYTFNEDPKNEKFFASNNIIAPTDKFFAIEGFNSIFCLPAGEDRDFCDKWQSYKYPTYYTSEITIYHYHSMTLYLYFRQHFNYGRASFYFHQTRAKRIKRKSRFYSVSFYINLILYPLKKEPFTKSLILMFLLVIAQVATVSGTLGELLKSKVNRKVVTL